MKASSYIGYVLPFPKDLYWFHAQHALLLTPLESLIYFILFRRGLVKTVNVEGPSHQLDDHNSDSSSTGDYNDEAEKIVYLHDDPLVPIYQPGLRKGLPTKKAVEILFHPRRDVVARAVPTAISMNSVFVVDISAPHVKHIKNILADDLGAWNPTGTKQLFYRAPSKRNPVRKASQSEFDDPHETHVYRCTRSFYRNESSPDLLKIFIHLTGRIISCNEY